MAPVPSKILRDPHAQNQACGMLLSSMGASDGMVDGWGGGGGDRNPKSHCMRGLRHASATTLPSASPRCMPEGMGATGRQSYLRLRGRGIFVLLGVWGK